MLKLYYSLMHTFENSYIVKRFRIQRKIKQYNIRAKEMSMQKMHQFSIIIMQHIIQYTQTNPRQRNKRKKKVSQTFRNEVHVDYLFIIPSESYSRPYQRVVNIAAKLNTGLTLCLC